MVGVDVSSSDACALTLTVVLPSGPSGSVPKLPVPETVPASNAGPLELPLLSDALPSTALFVYVFAVVVLLLLTKGFPDPQKLFALPQLLQPPVVVLSASNVAAMAAVTATFTGSLPLHTGLPALIT